MIEHGSAGMEAGGLVSDSCTYCAYPRSNSLVLYRRADLAIRTIAERRSLTVIKKFDHCFSQLLARVSCPYGFSREIEPEPLARLVSWSMTLKALALRLRCSHRGKKAAEVVPVTRPRPRGIRKYPP